MKYCMICFMACVALAFAGCSPKVDVKEVKKTEVKVDKKDVKKTEVKEAPNTK